MRFPPPIEENPELLLTDDGLRLEGRRHTPAGALGRAAICHPHPLMGGTMQNKVVTTCVRAAAACDYATVRFNFRGVGRSEGRHDEGRGEVLDVRAALRAADRLVPDGGRALIGFSFGSVCCCNLLSLREPTDQVDQLVLVGLPLRTSAPKPPPLPAAGLLVVIGDRDTFVTVEAAEAWLAGYQDRQARLAVVEGADHFFGGKLSSLAEQIQRFIG